MSVEILLPKIDEAMTKGKIIEWKKKEGEWVEKGEIVFTLETEKVTWEVEASESGILSQVRYQPGEEVSVGARVALLLKPGEKAPEPMPAAIPTGPEDPSCRWGPGDSPSFVVHARPRQNESFPPCEKNGQTAGHRSIVPEGKRARREDPQTGHS